MALRHTTLEVETSTLLRLSDASDPERCGRKAAALADLITDGFEIPDGFVIPVGATPTEAEVGEALGWLGHVAVAVRSSGVVEDLENESHAGHYESYLNLTGAAAVLAAAAKCRWSAGNGSPMAVLVQAMVDADAAGVAFSANPISGDRSEARVSAIRGLGDRLAAGLADGDEWSVRDGEARPIVRPHGVIDAEMASGIATLARRVEAARGMPQDIEWALEGGRLLLLQARPITALPVRPAIEVPSGTWQKDSSHFPEPVSPFAASTHLAGDWGAKSMLEEWGLMPDDIQVRVIGHEFYVHVEPDDGGASPPPWWILALVARLLPSLRRKLKRARQVIEEGLLDTLPAQWEDDLKPRLRTQLHAFGDVELHTFDDVALFAHLDELRAFASANMLLHFRLNMPHVVGLHDLAQLCAEALGWDAPQTMRLLQGLSTASSAPTRELATIARFAADRPAARAVIEARGRDVLERLVEEDREVGERLRAYLGIWGLRTFGSDAGTPSIAEHPEIVAGMLADLLTDDGRGDLMAQRDALIAEARAQLEDASVRRRFDTALAYAERVYPLREDNVILTDQLPTGLLRRAGLEIGRRLVARGVLDTVTDVFMLPAFELREGLLRGAAEMRGTVARRKAELLWVRAHPGPAVYGPAPGATPDLRGLPEAARRLNGALLWELEQEWASATPSEGDVLGGMAASAGVYRGRVRVIRSVEGLAKLEAGEVLVCPATSSAWMMVFQRAGALVTDHGSTLSHTAIVAREHGLPAVVATGNATARLKDGEEVIVDGQRGTVRRCG
jgi:phosphohistidine swiveling domain-containing protein